MVVVVLSTLVTSIATTIGLFENIATTYDWLKKVASTKWKEELDKYIKYLQVVKEVTRRYGTSNWSETSITGALQLLDGELKESWSKVDEWMPKSRVYKQLMADDFINEMKSSRTTIHENLQLLSTAVQTYREQEGNPARPQTQQAVPQEGNTARPQTQQAVEWVIFFGIACLVVITEWTVITNWTVIFFRIITKWTVIACLVALGYGKLRVMEMRRKLEKEKEKEENEYKAWLEENITERMVITYWTDLWPSYKTVWEGATNSKLDLAERKRLFENHVDGLLEQFLRRCSNLVTPQGFVWYQNQRWKQNGPAMLNRF